jgi:hypothetical protein
LTATALLGLSLLSLAFSRGADAATNPVCDTIRGVQPSGADRVLRGAVSVGPGEIISPPGGLGTGLIWLVDAYVTVRGTPANASVLAGSVVLRNSTLYVDAGASLVLGPASYSGQYSVWLSDNSTIGIQTAGELSFGSAAHLISSFLTCDSSQLFFNAATLLGSTQPAPFLFESSKMTLSAGTGAQALFEVSVYDSGSVVLFNSVGIPTNVYFFLNSDVTGSPNIVVPAPSTGGSGNFAIGSASLAWASSNVFIGGFWIQSGAKAVFEDSPNLLLFVSLSRSSNVTDLRPRTYAGTTFATPSCLDQPCSMELGFIRSTTLITNVYWDKAGTYGVYDSTVGELSLADAGAGGVAHRTVVDGSGGYLGVKGDLKFHDGMVYATTSAFASGLGRFYNTTFTSPSKAQVVRAGDSSTIVLVDSPVNTQNFTFETSSNGVVVEMDLFRVPATLSGCTASIVLTDFFAMRAHFSFAGLLFDVTAEWVGEGISVQAAQQQIGATTWSSATVLACPPSSGSYELRVTALPLGRVPASTSVSKWVVVNTTAASTTTGSAGTTTGVASSTGVATTTGAVSTTAAVATTGKASSAGVAYPSLALLLVAGAAFLPATLCFQM